MEKKPEGKHPKYKQQRDEKLRQKNICFKRSRRGMCVCALAFCRGSE